jgi:TusA-related sulfurtransferase
MRDQLIKAARAHFISNIEKHRMNVEVMLNNPIAIHDHTDWMTAMEAEIAQIAEYEDKLEVINKYFKK